MISAEPVDLLVIGGGINGCGITRDAAGRGLSVVLCEKGDLAQATSSRSGKLIHGGLRYLEYYEFRLVREALSEREVLLRAAPHIIWPLRFVLPHSPDDRPAWLIRLGLFLYDHLGRRQTLPGTRVLDLRRAAEGEPIAPAYRRAFEYSDCWVDDARLVLLNALDASERGAHILTRTRCRSAERFGGLWRAELEDRRTGRTSTIMARALVNAAGPWVEGVIADVTRTQSRRKVRLVKGSHLVLRKFWQGPHAYLLQNDDRRVIFVCPYEQDFCLVGTTDIAYDGAPVAAAVEEAEIDYLLRAINRYFEKPLGRRDIVGSFSGVRPLYDDASDNPSAVTRDYVLDVDAPPGQAPLLSVFGGKITTFRKLAEHALGTLAAHLPGLAPAWAATAALPGGDIADFARFAAGLEAAYPGLPPALLRHAARLYGTRAGDMLGTAATADDLGRHFGGLLYEREARYLIASEWALSPEDILERRTKHGLHLSSDERQSFEAWMQTHFPLLQDTCRS